MTHPEGGIMSLRTSASATQRTIDIIRRILGSDRGAVLPLVAVMMIAMLSMGALAIDLGMALTARSETQRVTDAASLAGASAFFDMHWEDKGVVAEAVIRGKTYAAANVVRGARVDTTTPKSYTVSNEEGATTWVQQGPEMTIQVTPQTQRVRVWVQRANLPAWFARLIGYTSLSVSTASAAEVSAGNTIEACVLPFAVVDLWDDLDDDIAPPNRIPDDGEEWFYENDRELGDGQEQDPYYTYDQHGVDGTEYGGSFDGTGYGSTFRNGQTEASGQTRTRDMGRRIVLKTTPGEGGESSGGSPGGGWDPNGSGTMGPGNFHLWSPPDPDKDCADFGEGADFIRDNIIGCNLCAISVGTPYPPQEGNVQSIQQSLRELYDQDPGAHWVDDPGHPDGGYINGSRFANPESTSPLVRVVPIMPPTLDVYGGAENMEFVQFAKIFLEPGAPNGSIYGRFLGGVSGYGGGTPDESSLIKYLRLVE